MDKDIEIVKEIKKALIDNYPELINKVIFYGSRAYGTPKEYSDYDILLVLNSDLDWKKKTELYYVCFDVALERDIITDIKITTTEKLKTIQGRQPFIIDAFERGLII